MPINILDSIGLLSEKVLNYEILKLPHWFHNSSAPSWPIKEESVHDSSKLVLELDEADTGQIYMKDNPS